MDTTYQIPRPDHKTAKKVEQALAVQQLIDTQAAAVYMCSRGVSFEVALRVLTRPAHRRRSA